MGREAENGLDWKHK